MRKVSKKKNEFSIEAVVLGNTPSLFLFEISKTLVMNAKTFKIYF